MSKDPIAIPVYDPNVQSIKFTCSAWHARQVPPAAEVLGIALLVPPLPDHIVLHHRHRLQAVRLCRCTWASLCASERQSVTPLQTTYKNAFVITLDDIQTCI